MSMSFDIDKFFEIRSLLREVLELERALEKQKEGEKNYGLDVIKS